MRPQPVVAFAAIGVLAGLVVSAWGSLFAVHTLYPSYVSAFVVTEPAAPRAAEADLETRTRQVLSGLRLNEDTAPETPQVELAGLVEAAQPPERPMPEAAVLQPTPQDMARLSEDDATTRAGSSLAQTEREAPMRTPSQDETLTSDRMVASAEPAEPLTDEPATAQTEVAMMVNPTALAVSTSLHPQTRPAGFVAPAAAPAPEAEVIQVADTNLTDADQSGAGLTTSTMNSASLLAVPSSPRPRALPNALRTAFAPTRQQAQEPAAEPDPSFVASSRVSGNGCGRNHARNMPNRRAGAPTGSAFMAAVGNGSGGDRDNAIINELARGNMPGFLQDLQPVVLRGKDARGASTEIVICVTPDYLALGSDRDFVRVPLGLPAAASIAGRFGMLLPTSRMVDAIYAQASVKLSPKPMQAGPQMSSTAYFVQHNQTIEAQRGGRAGLISGHKKDVVMANRMASNPGRVAIYGWHRSNGNPIQPVSTVHGASYADYSHGIRLVSRTAYLNGRAVDLEDLLSSSRYAYLLNSDGPLPGPVIRVASR
ncbi:MAG: hypothetical protein VX874_10710 [Pseudomonadota bacterium]|nr:hypothetical protein [Pseudomonadota bacterium]